MGINFDKTCSGCGNNRTYSSINSINISNNNNKETVILKNKDINLPKNISHFIINDINKNIFPNKRTSRNKINITTLSNASTGNVTNKKNSPISIIQNNPNNLIKYIPKNSSKENAFYILDTVQKFGLYKTINNTMKYVGYLDDDLKFHSYGNFKNYKDNTSFIGEFDNNKANGYGIFKSSRNTAYEGYWKNDSQYSIGIEIWEDNSFYKGDFSYGKKNGIGSYFWPDKSYYKGEWKDNLINGYGIYVFSSNKIYRGEFKNNQFEGYGEFMHDNDHIYMGNFVKDKKEGFGFFIWNFQKNNEKKAYLGFWKDNKMNGYGRIFHKNASRFSLWKKGKKIRDFINFEDCLEHYYSNDYWIQECKNLEKYKKLFMFSLSDIERIITKILNENKNEIDGVIIEEEKTFIKNSRIDTFNSKDSHFYSSSNLSE